MKKLLFPIFLSCFVILLSSAAESPSSGLQGSDSKQAETSDRDGDKLTYRWWQYTEADSYSSTIDIRSANKQRASFKVPADAQKGDTIHAVCEVADTGLPQLTRYQRIVITV